MLGTTPVEKHLRLGGGVITSSKDIEHRLALLMKHQKEKFVLARSQSVLRRRQYRRVSWGIVADRVERHFSTVCRCAQTQSWWEHLYVYRDDDHRTVQLCFGKHPVPSFGSTDIERGATLVVSQNVLGGVIVLFYPFETDAIQRIKSRVIWGVLDGPEELSEGLLLKSIDEFLTYSRVSSVLFSNSCWDVWRASWLEHCSRLFEGSVGGMRLWGATIATLIVGSITAASIYIAWALNPELKWPEPWAGLVTLITGWVAFRVQLGRDAVDKAMAREEAEKADRAHNQRLESSK